MTSEKKYPTINGNDYYVKVKETSRYKRVSVYNNDTFTRPRRSASGGTYITERVESRGRVLWFGRDTTPSIEKMVKDTVNEAVCIRENKESEKDEYADKIAGAVDAVREAHEE